MFYYIPWISAAVIIVALSHQPGSNLPQVENPFLDKAAHLLEYCILALCTIRVFGLWGPSSHAALFPTGKLLAISVLVFILVFGLADEYHQRFVEGRVFDLVDLAMDCLGGIVVVALYALASPGWRREYLT